MSGHHSYALSSVEMLLAAFAAIRLTLPIPLFFVYMRKVVAILGIGLMTLIAAAIIVYMALRLARSQSPLAAFPASTLALVMHPTEREEAILRAVFPDVRLPPHSDTLALFPSPQGTVEWVAGRLREGKFTIENASSPLARSILTEKPTLATDPLFHQAFADQGAGPWLLLRMQPDDQRMLPSLFPHLSLASSQAIFDATASRFYVPAGSDSHALPPIFLPFPEPSFVWHTADGERTLSSLSSLLKEESLVASTAWISQFLRVQFGDVSPREDIVPLLSGPSSISIAPSASGTLLFLEGTLADAHIVKRTAQSLREAFKAHLPAIRRDMRTFDEQWTWESLEYDPSSIHESQTSLHGWDVQTLTHASRSFFTAQAGGKLILTNDATALQRRLEESAALFLPSLRSPSDIIWMDIPALRTLSPALMDLLWPERSALLQGELFLTRERQGNVAILRVRPFGKETFATGGAKR